MEIGTLTGRKNRVVLGRFLRVNFGADFGAFLGRFLRMNFGVIFGVIFGGILEGEKKVSAESFKKESAVCLDEKRSLLQKKAQLFLYSF